MFSPSAALLPFRYTSNNNNSDNDNDNNNGNANANDNDNDNDNENENDKLESCDTIVKEWEGIWKNCICLFVCDILAGGERPTKAMHCVSR